MVSRVPRAPRGLRSAASMTERAQAVIAAGESAIGWTPGAGLPHPTQGYHNRTVRSRRSADNKALVRANFHDDLGRHHRTGAPAVVDCDITGAVVRASWYDHGDRHRAGGPSVVGADPEEKVTFHHRGLQLTPTPGVPDRGARSAAACEHYLACLALGDTPTEAIIWLRAATVLGAPPTAAVRQAGGQPDLLAPALDAGLFTDLAALTQVSTGELPLSWAIAGR